MTRGGLITLLAVTAAVVAAIELIFNRGADGTLLITLTVWSGILQGSIAVVAVGVLSKGLWIIPVRRELLSVYPLLLVLALLYLIMGTKMDIYPWVEAPNAWLNKGFFVGRNFALLLLSFVLARGLAIETLRGSAARATIAVAYVLVYVIGQSLVAFDWIMSLEYPWISTLFGGYFFIEGFLLGLTMIVWIVFFRTRVGAQGLTKTLRDAGMMMFGFCFMWGGFFFTQYLVIWYGNIPEEVNYVLKRVDPEPYWTLSRIVLVMVFLMPFLTLVFRKAKTNPWIMLVVALFIELGLLLEKIVMVTPVVPVNYGFMAVELIALGVAVAGVFRMRDSFMPQAVIPDEERGGHGGATDLASALHK